ncbi:hypothetical protein SLA2020_181350 [Shorea laevis]
MAGTSGAGRGRMRTRSIPHSSDAPEVAFSKRCSELFKEASELSTLCAVETALVIFSPEGKAFSFGHPSVDSVLNRLVNSGKPDSDSSQHAQDDDEATLEELTKKCSALLEELEAAQKRNDKLKEMLEEDQRRMNLLTRPLDELSIEELKMVTSIADELLEKVERKKELLVGSAAPAAISGGESDASVGDPTGETSSADVHGHNNGQDE